MNSKKFGSRVKGFTLVEMLVVITIIAILAGITSVLINGFQRDARMETSDNYAKMLYTGFQNQLIQCEIKQDDSLFDSTPSINDDLVYAEVYFKMEAAQVSDKILVASRYKTTSLSIHPLAAERGDAVTGEWFNELEAAILSMVDTSFEGLGVIFIDYENYTVDSAMYVEKGSFTSDVDNYPDMMIFLNSFNTYADEYYWSPTSVNKTFRMLNTSADQMECIEREGIYFGAYPTVDDFIATSRPNLSP